MTYSPVGVCRDQGEERRERKKRRVGYGVGKGEEG